MLSVIVMIVFQTCSHETGLESRPQTSRRAMSSRAGRDEHHDFNPFDCLEGGERYRQWRREYMNYEASKIDDSGSSRADHLNDIDMGGGAVGAIVSST